VSYAYDANGNLASVVDALGFTTTFGYTPAGGPAPAGLLSEIFYPTRPGNAFVTNRYDMLGRVATQTNANGATWSYSSPDTAARRTIPTAPSACSTTTRAARHTSTSRITPASR